MAKEPQFDLGQFAAGEIPAPLRHTFRDFLGEPLVLTGFSVVTMQIEAIPGVAGPIGDGVVSIVDAGNGVVQYQWSATDMLEASSYRAQLWVWDTAMRRYASDVFVYEVYDGPGVAPLTV